jgi:hypothetical protein
MAKEKPQYEVNEEFNSMAVKIVEKYPEQFYGIDIDKICCVNIMNKERSESKKIPWKLEAVKMPVALHCPYGWYVILYSSDWDSFNDSQKLLLVAEVLHGVPRDESDEGMVVPMDVKGFGSMFRTFKTIDYLDNPASPNILVEDIEWINSRS